MGRQQGKPFVVCAVVVTAPLGAPPWGGTMGRQHGKPFVVIAIVGTAPRWKPAGGGPLTLQGATACIN